MLAAAATAHVQPASGSLTAAPSTHLHPVQRADVV